MCDLQLPESTRHPLLLPRELKLGGHDSVITNSGVCLFECCLLSAVGDFDWLCHVPGERR